MSSSPDFTPQRFLIVLFYFFLLTAVPLITSEQVICLWRCIIGELRTHKRLVLQVGSDQWKLLILGSGSWICHQVVNQMIQRHFNIRTVTSLIRHVTFFSLTSLEPYGVRLESTREKPLQLYACILCWSAAVGVSHSSCVASLLPAAVAGWCLRCLLGGLCPRYSSTWLWVSQREPFVYADRMCWLLTWKKWPRRVVL